MIEDRFKSLTLPAQGALLPAIFPKDKNPYLLRGVALTYTCDANAGNRHVSVFVQDGGNNTVAEFAVGPLVANDVKQCTWADGITTTTLAFNEMGALSNHLVIWEGYTVGISANNAQVGDTFSLIVCRKELLTSAHKGGKVPKDPFPDPAPPLPKPRPR